MKKRIWELDAFRGICILGMVAVHFVYDLVDLYRIWEWEYPAWFSILKQWGGVLFLLLSGICVTLGSRSVRRGLIVFGCGLVVSAVTAGMYLLKLQGIGILIYFGVLHCLGACMILWPLFKRLPWQALAGIGALLAAAGLYLGTLPGVSFPWLMPLGLPWEDFCSSDYFPLLPNLGYFLIGAALGRTVYRAQESLLPRVNSQLPVLRFCRFCGRHSLWIYLLHQPVLYLICLLLMQVQ